MSKTLSVLLTVIIIIVLGGVGYYFLNQNFKDQKADLEKQITDLQAQIKTAQDALTSTLTADTSDWKTYSSDKYGFSFKYPDDWMKTSCKQGSSTFSFKPITTNSQDCFIVEKTSAAEHPGMLVMIYDGTGVGVEESNFSYGGKIVNEKLTIKSVDEIGKEVKQRIADSPNGPTNSTGDYGTTSFKLGDTGQYMFISAGYKYGGTSYRTILHSIISSFQFTK